MNTTTLDANWNVEERLVLFDPAEDLLELGRSLYGKYGTYTVLNLLAEEGQSRVYRGLSEQKDRVIIKEYKENYRSKAFEREMYVHGIFQINSVHPSIIPAWEFLIEQNRPIAIFPYLQGNTLEDLIESPVMWDQEDIVPIVSTLCDVADYMHNLDIVNRDFKPGNVIINQPDPQRKIPFVFDFGIAWHPDIAYLDETQGYYATPNYMAPEKWAFPAPDRKEDIYSIAVMIYEILSGTRPFNVSTIGELSQLHSFRVPVPDLTSINCFVSDEVRTVLEKGLRYDPAERYQTAGELKEDYLKAVGRK